MNRTYRKLASWIGIVAVVFAQLAVSAYACPLLLQSDAGATDAVVLTDVASDSSSFVSSGLCQNHCENEQQIVNDTPPQPLASVVLEPAFVALVAMNLPEPLSARLFAPSLLHATSPPHSIRNCCFRI